ncbi:MAG: NAD(P)-dependent oxidoreductase [Alphaproteobacteria bacterium]|jgi:3-hydroxyisobutyrate dehydrogenase-like beta-hydroxyacid dehydrogenase|nr:NAD(P)-dependent oxidoreductase [Alphaproteobacteria bacterium]MDP6517247.1 NAD(P)-dependent oxidoreductase [Alphaproteobacteria bacterium]
MTTQDDVPIGFIGLGNMGAPMSANLAKSGHGLVVYDAAGTASRAPAGARPANGVAGVAAAAETVLLSLPDGAAVAAVVAEIADAPGRAARVVVDHSTIGIAAAEGVQARLAAAGIGYLDAPVSGGVSGAEAGSLALMASGDKALFDRLDPLLAPIAANRFYVGARPGQAQAMKLLNNFLAATAICATSEAIAFGTRQGLDLALMLDVLNASSGQNTATSDKFSRRVLTGTYDAGFTIDLLTKDVRLYLEQVAKTGTRDAVGGTVGATLEAVLDAMPGADITRIYSYTQDH